MSLTKILPDELYYRIKYSKEISKYDVSLTRRRTAPWWAAYYEQTDKKAGQIFLPGGPFKAKEYVFLHELGHAEQNAKDVFIYEVNASNREKMQKIVMDIQSSRKKTIGDAFKNIARVAHLTIRKNVDNIITVPVEADATARAVVTAFKHDGLSEAISTGVGLMPGLGSYMVPAAISGTMFAGVGYVGYKIAKRTGAWDKMVSEASEASKDIVNFLKKAKTSNKIKDKSFLNNPNMLTGPEAKKAAKSGNGRWITVKGRKIFLKGK